MRNKKTQNTGTFYAVFSFLFYPAAQNKFDLGKRLLKQFQNLCQYFIGLIEFMTNLLK